MKIEGNMDLSKREKRRLRIDKLRHESHSAQEEYNQRIEQHSQSLNQQASAKKSRLYFIAAVVGVVILGIVAFSAYSYSKPGPYDSFAKCLTEKGAVMYGAMDWCKYTQGQRAMFGKSFKYVDYHEFNELPGIRKTPTWVIGGQWHENAQSFGKLAELTGCKLGG